MRSKVQLRELTADERTVLEELARTRTAHTRLVERAKILRAVAGGERPNTVAERLEVTRVTVSTWIKRFNAEGIDGLQDQLRRGRPATFPPGEIAPVVATALPKPQEWHLEFGTWTLDRLETSLNEHTGIGIPRARGVTRS